MNDLNQRQMFVQIAKEMLSDRIDLIEGCRELTKLSKRSLNPQDEIFIPFRAIDSETDHFPIGKVREQCAPQYLLEVDEEKSDYLKDTHQIIKDACHKLIETMSRKI